MEYHLVTTGGGQGKSDWEVHKVDCADVKRALKQHSINAANVVEADSPEALVLHELDIELRGMGYSESDFRIMPCVRKAG